MCPIFILLSQPQYYSLVVHISPLVLFSQFVLRRLMGTYNSVKQKTSGRKYENESSGYTNQVTPLTAVVYLFALYAVCIQSLRQLQRVSLHLQIFTYITD